MKKSFLFKYAGVLALIAAPALHAQTVNFHNDHNGAGTTLIPGYAYDGLYVGQGAYSDPGNNIWNGFHANTAAPGSTAFYGNPGNPYPATGGNPGNPYAWYGGVSTSGPTVWGQGGTVDGTGQPTGTFSGNADSSGALSPITLTFPFVTAPPYTGDFGSGVQPVNQGTPKFVLGEAAVINGATPTATFELDNVPAGTYTLYLYSGAPNYDRGAAFTVSSGSAFTGVSNATNNPAHSAKNFVLGENYVVFTNVVPASGVITGTWGAVSNSFSGLNGEGDLSAIQLIAGTHPPVSPTKLAISVKAARTISWTPITGVLQSSTNAAGPWTDIPGATSPFSGSPTLFYRVLGH